MLKLEETLSKKETSMKPKTHFFFQLFLYLLMLSVTVYTVAMDSFFSIGGIFTTIVLVIMTFRMSNFWETYKESKEKKKN